MGMTRVYGYDTANRLMSVVNTMAAGNSAQGTTADTDEYDYTYDKDSNRQTETRKTDNQMTRSIGYGYDALDRVTSASYTTPGGSPTASGLTYGYDPVGNRMTQNGTNLAGASA
jgi:hypothetical protein